MLFILLQRIFTFCPQRRGQEEIGIFLHFSSYNKGDAVALLLGKPDVEADLAPKCICSLR